MERPQYLTSLLVSADRTRSGLQGMCFGYRGRRSFWSNKVNSAGVIVGKKKCIWAQFENIARPADHLSVLQKTTDQVLQPLAFSHYDDLVTVPDSLIRGTVQGDDESALDRGRGVCFIEIIETEG